MLYFCRILLNGVAITCRHEAVRSTGVVWMFVWFANSCGDTIGGMLPRRRGRLFFFRVKFIVRRGEAPRQMLQLSRLPKGALRPRFLTP